MISYSLPYKIEDVKLLTNFVVDGTSPFNASFMEFFSLFQYGYFMWWVCDYLHGTRQAVP